MHSRNLTAGALVAVFLLTALFIPLVHAGPGPNDFRFNPFHYNLSQAIWFYVDVKLSANDSVYAAEAEISFDPSMLTAGEVLEGDFFNYDGASTSFPVGVSIDNATGRIYFANTRLNPAVTGVSGDRTLCTIKFFSGTTPGTTELEVVNASLSDENFLSLTYSTQKGLRTINMQNGDVDGNCLVNIFDLARVGMAYGTQPGSPYWNQNADLNADGEITIIDLAMVGMHYRERCEPTCTPTTETCNGLDDDCDGTVDEDFPGLGNSCGVGACAGGTMICTIDGAGTECDTAGYASTEVCDGVDNDCDGSVDEGNPGGGGSCNTGLLGVCSAGTETCSGGSIVCVQDTASSTEVCDGLDNDCDGLVDEGFDLNTDESNCGTCGNVCVNGTTPACCSGVCTDTDADDNNCGECGTVCDSGYCAEGACVIDSDGDGFTSDVDCDDNDGTEFPGQVWYADCDGDGYYRATAVTSCDVGEADALTPCVDVAPPDGGWSHTAGNDCDDEDYLVYPAAPEACDALDNDCDGLVDESLTQTCYTGPAGTGGVGECHDGTQTCSSGIWGSCTGEMTPVSETCDGLDNDCDGATDNNMIPPPCVLQMGVCNGATKTCAGASGWQSCTSASYGPYYEPTELSCDTRDNDCDGDVDEGGVCGSCGDGSCDTGEDAGSCPEDCPAVCSDGMCTHTETASSCATDCPAVCGDEYCTHEETASSCATDCPAVCGDGYCTHSETPASCSADCPCSHNAECDSADYCEKIDGDCDGTGTCTAKPVTCPDVWDPVCACDGMTYSNACYARFAGTNTDYSGACVTWTCFGIDKSDVNVCSGHGVCTATDTCSCEEGWTGADCSTLSSWTCNGIPYDDPNVCSAHGICTEPDTCVCDSGWEGNECSSSCVDLDEPSTWGTKIEIISDDYYLAEDVTLCKKTYNLNDKSIVSARMNWIHSLDCNGATLVGNMSSNAAVRLTCYDPQPYLPCTASLYVRNCNIESFNSGININHVYGTTVEDNNISNCNYGISFAGVESGFIRNNNILNTAFTALSVDRDAGSRDSKYNIIEDNYIDTAGQRALFLRESVENTLTGNTFIGAGIEGVYVWESANNTIYNNYFDSSTNVNSNVNSFNYWNLDIPVGGPNIVGGPLIGGNYWSDYVGADTNSDGLGDTLIPYNTGMNGGDGDFMPLVLP